MPCSLSFAALLALLLPATRARIVVEFPPLALRELEEAIEEVAQHAVCLLQRNSTVLTKAVRRPRAPHQQQERFPLLITAGVMNGVGPDDTAQPVELGRAAAGPPSRHTGERVAAGARELAVGEIGAALPKRSKVALVLIEAFPPLWLLAVDRFYLGAYKTGIVKLVVSLATCGVGGAVWGLVDFLAVMVNSLSCSPAIERFGLGAVFTASEVDTAFYVAIVAIALWPSLVIIGRAIWWWRRRQRDEMLREARTSKSPLHFDATDYSTRVIYGTISPKSPNKV